MKTAKRKVKSRQATADGRADSTAASTARWGNEVQGGDEPGGLKRFAILRKAAELFNERGFYETSLNELAKRLNVTKPSLYYYVKNKDDILLQIMNQAVLEFTPAMTQAEQSGLSGLEKLKIFVTQYTVAMTGLFGKCMVLCGLGPLEPSSRDELTPTFRLLDTFVRKLLAEGMQDGSIAPCDAKITAFSIFGAMHWLARWYRSDGELSAQEIARQVCSLFESGLKPAHTSHTAILAGHDPEPASAAVDLAQQFKQAGKGVLKGGGAHGSAVASKMTLLGDDVAGNGKTKPDGADRL